MTAPESLMTHSVTNLQAGCRVLTPKAGRVLKSRLDLSHCTFADADRVRFLSI